MTVSDFIRKEAGLVREHGVGTALRRGASEATWKGLSAALPLLTTPVWSADWDVCLVLDGCRMDVFREVARDCGWLPDRTPSKWSVGSASPEWISQTFAPDHGDAIRRAGYVTANPFSGKSGDELAVMNPDVYPLSSPPLAYLDEVWRDQWPTDPNLPTVAPEVVTDRALWAWQRRDRLGMDRLIVHYMQPHIPFRARPEWFDGWKLDGFGTGGGLDDKDGWKKVRDGELDRREFWAAYRDNLRWVLDDIRRWYEGTNARILITSDHGNGMGEWGVWSHPPRNAAPILRRVPWVSVDGVARVDPTPEPAGDPPVTSGAAQAVEDQLRALGYAEAGP